MADMLAVVTGASSASVFLSHMNMPRVSTISLSVWPLLKRVEKSHIDPSSIISHRITLDESGEKYKVWRDKRDNVTRIVVYPWAERAA
jgi:threonine dehydrogenase-like Zn-dependent dehydrogenase